MRHLANDAEAGIESVNAHPSKRLPPTGASMERTLAHSPREQDFRHLDVDAIFRVPAFRGDERRATELLEPRWRYFGFGIVILAARMMSP